MFCNRVIRGVIIRSRPWRIIVQDTYALRNTKRDLFSFTRVAAGHSHCSGSNCKETVVQEAVYERNIQNAFGTDLRGFFVALAVAGRPQLRKLSGPAAVRSSQAFGSWIAICATPFNSTRPRLKPLFTRQSCLHLRDTAHL